MSKITILPIYTYNHPVLKQPATPVQEITDELRTLAKTMMATMHNADGIGLAANQVGDGRAITTIDISEMEDKITGKTYKTPPLILVNPVITSHSDETAEFEEGCLSLPQYRDTVIRPEKIHVTFYDLEMKEHNLEADALLARVIQHEVDHLNGIYFFERLSVARRALGFQKLRRIQLGHVQTEYPLFEEQTPSPQKNEKIKKR